MKMTFGRKFWSGLVGILILLYMFTLSVFKATAAMSGTVIIVYGTLVVTIVFMYIGGNVWNAWIKSKYFRSDLVDK